MAHEQGIIPKIVKRLQLKGQNETLKTLMRLQKTPCMIEVYFRLACTAKKNHYCLFLPPDWKWRNLHEQLEELTSPWVSWIDEAGVVKIDTLILPNTD